MAIRFDQIQLSDDGNHLYPYIEGTDGYLAIRTTNGLLRIGAGNSTYSHFYTDRSNFYFNKATAFDGTVSAYGGDEDLTNWDNVDASAFRSKANTAYLLDPDGASNIATLTSTGVTISNQDPSLNFTDLSGSTYSAKWRFKDNDLQYLWGGGIKAYFTTNGIGIGDNGTTADARIERTGSSPYGLTFKTNNISALSLDSSQNAIFAGDLEVNGGTNGITVDSAGHASVNLDRASTSYDNNLIYRTNGAIKWRIWQDGSSDFLHIRDEANSSNMVSFQTGGNTTFAGNISIPVNKSLYFGGGSHTYIREDIDDRLRFFTGGAEFMRFSLGNNKVDFYKNVEFAGNLFIPNHSLYVGDYIYHEGDTNTHIYFGTDRQVYTAGSTTMLQINKNYYGSQYTGLETGIGLHSENLGGANLIKKGTDIAVSTGVREEVTGPDGSRKVQAHASTGNGNNTNCYQWYTSENVVVNPEKDYEFSVWIKSTGDDHLYLGWHEYNSSGTKISSNPYFHTSKINTSSVRNVNGWVLLKYQLKSHRTTSGQADTEGTDRYASNGNSSNFQPSGATGVMHSTTKLVHLRLGTCYGSVNGSKSYFYNPKITEAQNEEIQWTSLVAKGIATDSYNAPVFYDKDNTAYFLDPANSVTSLNVAGGGIFQENVTINSQGGTDNYYLTFSESGSNRLTIYENSNNVYFNSFAGHIIFRPRMAGSGSFVVSQGNTQFDTSGNATFAGSVTATSFIKSGGTSSQFLMADGSVSTGGGSIDGSGASNRIAIWSDSDTLTSDVNIVNNGGQLQLGNGLLVEDNDTTVITAKAYEPHIVWQKTRGSSGDDFFKIKAENDAMVVDFTTARDGGSDTRVLRIDNNNNFVFSTNGSYTQLHTSFMSVYGRLTSTADIRSTQYYDYNDTSKYIDLNSTGTSLVANGSATFGSTIHVNSDGLTGYTNSRIVLNSTQSNYRGAGVFMHNTNDDQEFYMGVPYAQSFDKFMIAHKSTASHTDSTADFSNALMSIDTSGHHTVTGSSRAPIFYDSNNTSYYTNPAGTSVMNDIELDDYIVHKGDTNTYFGFNGADQWKLHLGGGDRLVTTTSQFTSNLNVAAPLYYDKDNTSYYLNPASTSTSLNVAGSIHSQHRKECTASISNSYVRVFYAGTVNNQLSTAVRVTGTAHGSGHVGNFTADILVNHYQDVSISSQGGAYTQGTIKVESDNNGQYTMSYKSGSPNAATYYFTIEALSSEVSITTNPTSTSATNTVHEHIINFGSNHTGEGGTLFHEFGGNIALDTGKNLYFDRDTQSHTYIKEEGDNNMKFYVGGTEHMAVGGGDIYLQQPVRMTSYLYHTGNTGTSMQYDTDNIKFRTGSLVRAEINSSGAIIASGRMTIGQTSDAGSTYRLYTAAGGDVYFGGHLTGTSATFNGTINNGSNYANLGNINLVGIGNSPKDTGTGGGTGSGSGKLLGFNALNGSGRASATLGVNDHGIVMEYEKIFTFKVEGSGWLNRKTNIYKLIQAPGADKMIVVDEFLVYIDYETRTGISYNGVARPSDTNAYVVGFYASETGQAIGTAAHGVSGNFYTLGVMPRDFMANSNIDRGYYRDVPVHQSALIANRSLFWKTARDCTSTSNAPGGPHYIKIKYRIVDISDEFSDNGVNHKIDTSSYHGQYAHSANLQKDYNDAGQAVQ